MLKMTQWVKVPIGASGSSIINANAAVPFGGFSHASGGDTFLPSQVYSFGIASPFLKAGLVSRKAVVSVSAPPAST